MLNITYTDTHFISLNGTCRIDSLLFHVTCLLCLLNYTCVGPMWSVKNYYYLLIMEDLIVLSQCWDMVENENMITIRFKHLRTHALCLITPRLTNHGALVVSFSHWNKNPSKKKTTTKKQCTNLHVYGGQGCGVCRPMSIFRDPAITLLYSDELLLLYNDHSKTLFWVVYGIYWPFMEVKSPFNT